jgi:hypothetical protein
MLVPEPGPYCPTDLESVVAAGDEQAAISSATATAVASIGAIATLLIFPS